MKLINIHEAKTQLSRIIEQVLAGENVVIARSGEPLVVLQPYKKKRARRTPETLKGRVKVTKDFFEPMDPDFMKYFS